MKTKSELDGKKDRENISRLLTDCSFEMLPTEGICDQIRKVLPKSTIVHLMCPPDKGADHTVEYCVDLANSGYTRVVPHIAARTVRDRQHLQALLQRMSDAGISSGFFPGGDGKEPYGTYTSAVELLEDLSEMDHGLKQIGIASYPEGHQAIPKDVLLDALMKKQRVATHMVTDTCLDSEKVLSWLRDVRSAGVDLPVWVGVPGIVPISRLVEACKEYGLAEAFRFLRKSHGIVGALIKGTFRPETVLSGLASHVEDSKLGIANAHLYTFNEVAKTAAWRLKAIGE